MSELDSWWIHTVAVESKLGSGAYGERFSDPAPVLCRVDDDVNLIRDASGSEAVSSSTLFAPLSLADLFPLGSLVTTSSGHEARVLGIERHDGDPGGLDHIEVHLS